MGLAGGYIWVIVETRFIKAFWRIEGRGEIKHQDYLIGLGLKQLKVCIAIRWDRWDLQEEEQGQRGGEGGIGVEEVLCDVLGDIRSECK